MKRYHVRPTSTTQLDWSRAELLTDFTFPWEDRPAPRTEFRALWDATYLHFRFDCTDRELVLPDAPTLKERVLGSDRVEIFFAPDLTLRPYYCFEMSPRAEALAYKASFYREMDWDWPSVDLQLAARINGSQYTVSGSFPLAALRQWGVLRADSPQLLAGLYRGEFSRHADGTPRPGWMPWVHPATPKPDFHVPASFGVLELMS